MDDTQACFSYSFSPPTDFDLDIYTQPITQEPLESSMVSMRRLEKLKTQDNGDENKHFQCRLDIGKVGSEFQQKIEAGCDDITFDIDNDLTLDSDSWSIQIAQKYPVISANEAKSYVDEIEENMNDVFSYGEIWWTDDNGDSQVTAHDQSVELTLKDDSDDSMALAYSYLASALLVIASVTY